jgi:hypothetical protein
MAVITTVPIRRLRQAGILSSENVDIRHDSFELAMQKGIGNVLPPGEFAEVVLQYSDDGGTTWSDEMREEAGPRGEPRTQVSWQRLGSSRNRVYRVWMTDPVFFIIVDAYISLQRGRF